MDKETADGKREKQPTPNPSREGNDWDGCDKLEDLMCRWPHCTCKAMSNGRGEKAQPTPSDESDTPPAEGTDKTIYSLITFNL